MKTTSYFALCKPKKWVVENEVVKGTEGNLVVSILSCIVANSRARAEMTFLCWLQPWPPVGCSLDFQEGKC